MYFNRGVTLIELIAILAIIATVTAVGMVSFSTLIGDNLESDARKIVGDLCWARQMAVANHQNYIIDFDVLNERYVIYRGSIAINNQVKSQDLVTDLVSLVPAPAQLIFSFPQGTTSNKQINLSYQGKTRQVRLFGNTGYVRIQ